MINRLPPEYRVSANGNGVVLKHEPKASAAAAVAKHAIDRAGVGIGAYPIASLATALVGGLVLGRWVKGL